MKKRISLRKRNLFKCLTYLIAFLVAVALISSSSISITINKISKIENIKIKEETQNPKDTITGLAPETIETLSMDLAQIDSNNELKPLDNNMYGYTAALGPHGEGPCYWDMEAPDDIIQLSTQTLPNFAAGGTWTLDERWIVCEYSNGALYEIDPETGDILDGWGGGAGLNGIAQDPITTKLYGASSNDFYEIDVETGDQEYIGPFGIDDAMIAITFDMDGVCYGWDVKFSGNSKLYTIDLDEGTATEKFDLGMNLLYAQDGEYNRADELIYLSAYSDGGKLITVDPVTEEVNVIGNFENNAEVTGDMIINFYFQYEHDIGVKNIESPENDDAGEDMDVIVKVKNYGNNTEEDISVNVVILKDGNIEEYNETEIIDELHSGESIDFEMPAWTPNDLQNVSNEYIDYKIAAKTTLKGDQNLINDFKEKWFELYFGYFHDVGIINLSGPETGPAQTFPVNLTIKNFGQYEECCFKTYAEIAEIDYSSSDELFSYDFPSCSPWPPDGWSRTHSNWECSNSDHAGGSAPELYFYYNPISYPCTYRFSSPKIDTTGYGAVEISFDQYQSYNYGSYTMEVETSNDGSAWTTVYSNTGPIGPETTTIVTGDNVGDDFYISFSVKTRTYSILYWYIDNLVIDAYPLKDPEYNDEYWVSDLDVGEELVIDFETWTPDYLQYETTDTKNYNVRIWTDMDDPPDENPDNDLILKYITLDYYHDVAINVCSPVKRDKGRRIYAVNYSSNRFIWFDQEDLETFHDIGKWPTNNYPQGGTFVKNVWWVCDTNGNIFKVNEKTGEYEFVGSTGTGILTDLSYHELSEVLYGCSTSSLYKIDMDTGKATVIGNFGGGSNLMITMDCDDRGFMYAADLNFGSSALYSIDLDTGSATKIGNMGWSLYNTQMSFDLDENVMWITSFDYEQWRVAIWAMNMRNLTSTLIGYFPNGSSISCLSVPYDFPPISVYITPGTESIEAIAENVGTFPEEDMSCNAEIYEYITNCTNGTLVYQDSITDIDITEPLGGTELLSFDDYNFEDEGKYILYLNLTDDNDDYPKNNICSYGIGCDDTPPNSWHYLDPPEPDGLNGWYVNDIEVTIRAKDPNIGCGRFGSGVDVIRYTVNGVPGTIPGDSGRFSITKENEGKDIEVVYWAVDSVGNEEPTHHKFTIDMDQTPPDVDLTYMWRGIIPPYDFIFIANATDSTSGMERVEFYLNQGLQKIINGPGPEFVWETMLPTCPNITIKVIAFDMAGHSSFDAVKNPTLNINSNSQSSNMNNKLIKNINIISKINPQHLIFRYQEDFLLFNNIQMDFLEGI